MQPSSPIIGFILPLALWTTGCTGPAPTAEKQAPVAFERPAGSASLSSEVDTAYMIAHFVNAIDPNINRILQDSHGNYWFGTNGGAYRYDGKHVARFTTTDGLTQDQVLDIQEDAPGNIWFSTGGFGVDRFDGQHITSFSVGTDGKSDAPPEKEEGPASRELWFAAGGGAFHYGSSSFSYLPFPGPGGTTIAKPLPPYIYSAYGVYVTLKDRKGVIWFGTQSMGVCRYDGQTFTWLTEKGLNGAAIRAIWEDRNGVLWFGNNGKGLFRYDGRTLTNVTDEAGLGNAEFIRSGRSGPRTLARVWAITDDAAGDLWIGTYDAGLWHYDGRELKQYTTKDGLPDMAVQAVLVDRDGRLWMGTEKSGVSTFDGKVFTPFSFSAASSF